VDPERIVFLGHSFGGTNVYNLLSQTKRAKAAIVAAGVFDLVSEWGHFGMPYELIRSSLNVRGRTAAVETGQYSMGGTPWEKPQSYLDDSPSFHAKDITTPVLILNGDVDYVSVEHAKFAYQALRRSNVPTRLVIFFGEVHNVSGPGNMSVAASEILKWLGEYLGRGSSPGTEPTHKEAQAQVDKN